MYSKVIIATAILASVISINGDSPPPYGAPYAPPAPHYKEPGKPYAYAYSVNDAYQKLEFGADEESDGNNVVGSYNVLLPDGRTQVVSYTADHHKGFVADVNFEGVATYPAPAPYQPAPYQPAPYKPAPAPYKPAPPPYAA